MGGVFKEGIFKGRIFSGKHLPGSPVPRKGPAARPDPGKVSVPVEL